MRREIVELIEATRGLRVQRAPRPENPKNIRIVGERKDFPDRLHSVALALEAVDRLGAAALDGTGDPTMDAARLRMAIDGVFRWMKAIGIDVSEPHAVVAAALGVKSKATKGYKPTPKFAPNGFKKNMKAKPLLRLQPGPGEKISLDSLRAKAAQAHQVEVSLGPAAPRL